LFYIVIGELKFAYLPNGFPAVGMAAGFFVLKLLKAVRSFEVGLFSRKEFIHRGT